MKAKSDTFRSFEEARVALEGRIKHRTEDALESGQSKYLEFLRLRGFVRLKDLRITAYFGRHSTELDAEHALEKLKGRDVWLFEQNRRSPNTALLVQEISRGTVRPDDVVRGSDAARNPYFTRLMRGVYGSGIRTAAVDSPETLEESAEASKVSIDIKNFADDVRKERWTYVGALNNFVGRLVRFAAVQKPREKRMVDNVPQAIISAYVGEEIEEIESVSVVMIMGAGHKPIFDMILNNHPEAVLSEQEPDVYTYVDEYIRRTIDGSKIPDDLTMKALTQTLLERAFGDAGMVLSDERSEYRDFMRRVIDKMSDRDREEFYTIFLESGESISEYVRYLAAR